jgi:hypothetical protein
VRPLRFLRRPDPDGDPIEWAVLEDTDLSTSVWETPDGWCWGVHQGKRFVDNGLADTRRLARLQSRRYAAGIMAHVLHWGRWS